MGVRGSGWGDWFKQRREREELLACLERFHLAELARCPVDRLSPGQRHCLFLARAALQNAELLVLDEPFAGGDPAVCQLTMEFLIEQSQRGRTVICTHEDPLSLPACFSHMVLLHIGIIARGTCAETLTDDNLRMTYGMAWTGKTPSAA
jgi:manganese/zinc/iron transport system ATP- binding protein